MKYTIRTIAALWILLCYCAGSALAQAPTIIYVDSAVTASGTGASWGSPLKTLSEGLWKAHTVSGQVQVWVRKGTYYPMQSPTVKATSRDSSFVIRRNNIQVYGGFAGTETSVLGRVAGTNTTTLSGDIGVQDVISDNSVHVVRLIAYPVTFIDASTVLDGFTICNGYADGRIPSTAFTIGGSPYKIDSYSGAGLYIFCNGPGYYCSPRINNCAFTSNTAYFCGAGAINDGQDADLNPIYTNCAFEDNSSFGNGGGIGNQSAGAVIRKCVFYYNYSREHGGAIYHQDAAYTSLKLEQNIFSGNNAQQGGAVEMNTGSSSLFAASNIFYDNRADIYAGRSIYNYGGAMNLVMGLGADTLINNLFVQNYVVGAATDPMDSTGTGSALRLDRGNSSYVVNNTFYLNNGSGYAGAALVFTGRGGKGQVFNNVFYRNYAYSAMVDMVVRGTMTSMSTGNNIIGTASSPFINEYDAMGPDGTWGTSDDGLQLSPCGPYINTGNNSKNPLGQDITGNSRVYGIAIDPGAYELQQAPLFLSDTLRAVICKGDSLLFDGVYYKTTQTHTDSFYNAIGCDSLRTLVLTVKTQAVPIVSTLSYCAGSAAAALTAVTGSSDTLLWYPALSGGVAGRTAPVPNTADTGTTVYYVSSKSAIGCESPRVPVRVNVVALPAVPTVVTPVAYCKGADAIPLTAAPAKPSDSLLWYTTASGGTGSTIAPVPATGTIGTTAYYVSGSSAQGCESDRVAIRVEVNAGGLPAVALSPADVLLCTGNHIMLYCAPADTGYHYKWYKDGVDMGLAPATTALPVGAMGSYQVRVSDTEGCADKTNSVNVSFYAPVVQPHIIRTGSTLRLDHGYSGYQWYRNNRMIGGATAISYGLSFDGTYYAAVLDANGCTANSDTLTIAGLGISEAQAADRAMLLYPNPTQGIVFIEAPVPVNVTVKDITGRVVVQLQHAQQVDLGAYADGVYLFVVTDEEDRIVSMQKIHKTGLR